MLRISLFILLIVWSVPLAGENLPAASGSISGIVLETETGKAVSGATVSLILMERGCPLREALSDEQGRFLFAGLEVARYRLDIRKDGYQRLTYGQTDENPAGRELILSPSTNSMDLEIMLPFSAAVAGHIYDEQGLPVSGASVHFEPVEIENRSFHEYASELGYYWISRLPPGLYRIAARRFSASAEQTVGESWYYPGTRNPDEAQLVALEKGKTAAIDIYFKKDRTPIWTGKVTDPSGEPVAMAEFTFLQMNSGKVWYQYGCRTGSNGQCEIRDLADGDYWVYLHRVPVPYANWIAQKDHYTIPVELYGQQVHIQSGKPASTDFQLDFGRTLEMRVYGPDGSRVSEQAGLSLILQHRLNLGGYIISLDQESQATGSGTFVVYGLHSELEYLVNSRHTDPYKRYCIMKITLNGRPLENIPVVSINDSNPAVLEVWLERSAAVAGSVKPEYSIAIAQRVAGDPIPESLYKKTFQAVAQEGKFLFRGLPPGTYRIYGRVFNQKEPSAASVVTLEPGETKEITLE